MIELKDIVVKFGDFEALHNINVEVREEMCIRDSLRSQPFCHILSCAQLCGKASLTD